MFNPFIREGLNMTREEEIKAMSMQAHKDYASTGYTAEDLEDYTRFILKWADEHPKNPWHKTDEDFPKEGVDYQMKDGEFLCARPLLLHICEDDEDSGDDYKGYFDGTFWRYLDRPMSCDVVMGKVTHWMVLPKLP